MIYSTKTKNDHLSPVDHIFKMSRTASSAKKGCYYYNWAKADLFPEDEKYEKRMKEEFAFMDDTAIKLGVFDQTCFYKGFKEFANQSIEKSLCSENLLVRIFAVLDRRVGKRKLLILKENIENESDSFKEFFAIRIRAEGIE